MSSTRKAQPGSAPSWEKYMSSSEFQGMRGLPGAAVSAKASLISDPRKRSLLFFLQALSCRQGGLQRLAAEILAAFSERLGSPTMHKLGMKPGQVYSQEDAQTIRDELGLGANWDWEQDEIVPIKKEERTAEFFLSEVRRRSMHFDSFLGELCTNPRLEMRLAGDTEQAGQAERRAVQQEHEELVSSDFTCAALPWFNDVVGALLDYQQRHAGAARAKLADTEVATKVFATLDRALRHRKMVVIEGDPGFGKTKAVETWSEMKLGEARFVTLSGCVNKTSIFHKIELALGLSFGQPKKSTQMQAAVESMLKRSGLMLVIDEAHFLFGQGERITSRPEMLDWIDTSCCNEGIAVALIATPQFTERLAHVEKRTLWQSKQFRRRIKDYVRLPLKISPADLEAIVRKLLPECGNPAIRLVMTSAVLSEYPLSYIASTVEDARELAREAGRVKIEFWDLDRVIREFRMPSDLAQKAAFTAQPKRKRASANLGAEESSESNEIVALRGELAAPLVTDNRLAAATV